MINTCANSCQGSYLVKFHLDLFRRYVSAKFHRNKTKHLSEKQNEETLFRVTLPFSCAKRVRRSFAECSKGIADSPSYSYRPMAMSVKSPDNL